MRAADPLAEARKFLTTLQQFCPEHIATHMAACEVFRRQGERRPAESASVPPADTLGAGKPLRVVQALNRARKISADDPEYHVQLVTFAHGRGRT